MCVTQETGFNHLIIRAPVSAAPANCPTTMFARNFVDDELCWADGNESGTNPCNKPGLPPLWLCDKHLAEIKQPDKCVAADLDGGAA